MTATSVAAEALGLAHEIGALEVGKAADIVLMNGDPTKDVTILRRDGGIRGVFRQGIPVASLWPALEL